MLRGVRHVGLGHSLWPIGQDRDRVCTNIRKTLFGEGHSLRQVGENDVEVMVVTVLLHNMNTGRAYRKKDSYQ